MKNQSKRIAATLILIALIISLSSVFPIMSSAEEEITGLTPGAPGRVKYEVANLLEVLPKTYELTISVPTDYATTYGIVASYVDAAKGDFVVGLNSSGYIYFSAYGDTSETVRFESADLRTGEWVHVALTIDEENSKAHLYLNGVLQESKDFVLPENTTVRYKTSVGGTKSINGFFTGSILDVAAYSDMRTAEEIASDYLNSPADDNLLFSYDFSTYSATAPADKFEDLSSKNNDAMRFYEFYDEPVVELDDYAYSFAIVGDTQVVNYYCPENLSTIYEWIRDNKDEKKIAFTMHLGDITDKNLDREWENAKHSFSLIDGVVPYSFVRGNHDRPEGNFNKYFSYEEYKHTISGSYDETMLNTYQKFEVCGNKYLILNLDYLLTKPIVDWANEVVLAHHDYNVIITTHIYLSSNGTTLDRYNDSNGADKYKSVYDGEELWNKLVSKHENIIMILSGHITSSSILAVPRVGDNGNTVMQMLIDPQGIDGKYRDTCVGMIAMLYFSADGKTVQTQYYSTIKEQYFMKESEYTFTVTPVQSNGEDPQNHKYDVMEHDEEKHWSKCACGDIINIVPHEFGDWIILYEPTEEKQGRRYCECVCGQRKIENYDYTPPLLDDEKDEDTIVTIIIMVGGILLIIGGTTLASFVFTRKKTNAPIQKVAEEEYQDEYPEEEFFENFEYNPDEEKKDGIDEEN